MHFKSAASLHQQVCPYERQVIIIMCFFYEAIFGVTLNSSYDKKINNNIYLIYIDENSLQGRDAPQQGGNFCVPLN